MDEIEARLAALELAFVEIAAELDPVALVQARDRIREGVGSAPGDENDVRRQAAMLLQLALDRLEPFTPTR